MPAGTSHPVLDSLQALPIGVHLVLGAGLVAGFILWLAGQRVIRPVFIVVGGVIGAALGFFVAPLITLDPIVGVPSPYLGLAIGGVLGLAAAIALFRFVMAVASAFVLAIAGMLAAGAALGTPASVVAPPAAVSPAGDENQPAPEVAATPEGWAREAGRRTREFLTRAGEAARARWADVPAEHRLAVAGAGIAGAIAGFVFGVFVPRRASAVITALAGSALWLGAAAWVAHATGAPGLSILDQPAKVWLIVWPVTAAIGAAVQLLSMRRRGKSEG